MASILDRLDAHGLRSRIIIDDRLTSLLGSLLVDPAGADLDGNPETGKVTIGYVGKPLGFFDLNFKAPVPDVPFRLVLDGDPAQAFSLYLQLSEASPAAPLFDFIAGVPGYALTGATVSQTGAQERLIAAGDVRLGGANLSLLVRGKAGGLAEMMLTPSSGGPEGIVKLAFVPDAVLLGGTGLGLRLPDGVVLDFSSEAKAPGQTVIDRQATATAADSEAWHGIVARSAKLYLPPGVPWFADRPIETAVAIGMAPTSGIDLVTVARVPAAAGRPEMRFRIECRDPQADGIAGLLPTVIEAEMTLPLDETQAPLGASAVKFMAGEPVTARLRLARRPGGGPPALLVALSVEAKGADGILAIDASTGGIPERAALAAGVLATALVADGRVGKQTVPGGDESGVYLHLLMTAALGLSAFLKQQGRLVLHRVELEAQGEGWAPTQAFALRIDYSVDALVDSFNVGVLSVGMVPDQPMRVRVRDVTLRIDTRRSGLEMINLDFDRANLELEDPGGWKVQGPGSLFDVLGTRSGRGSMWIEVDLRFALDLGPVRVSGATIRATLKPDGSLGAELRGLDASLSLPGVVEGRGRVAQEEGGFSAELAVSIVPLNLSASAAVGLKGKMVSLALGVDLPGPIPLANSGLALFGVGGAFAANGRPAVPDRAPDGSDDIVSRQLAWDAKAHGFAEDVGNTSFGVEAVIGTAPDMGFTMSAKGGLFLTVPDLVVRAGLSARLFSPRLKVTDRPSGPSAGVSFTGVAVIDPADAVTIGFKGRYLIPHVVDVTLPFGARFPTGSGSDWFIYLGADGAGIEDRSIGPVRAVVLPDLVGSHADAYLMLRGNGIHDFGPEKHDVDRGFVIAFGFGFEFVMGVRGVIWAEVNATAAVLIATDPLLFAGYGRVGGGLHLGPVSIGVGAELTFKRVEGQPDYLFARICGSVDLFFFELEGCVELSVGAEKDSAVPLPTQHPLERREGDALVPNIALVDDHYTHIATPTAAPDGAPVVWPDSIVLLSFGVPPKLAAGAIAQFPAAETTYGMRARPLGGELLSYQWSLTSLKLFECTADPHGGTELAGEYSSAWQAGKFDDPQKSPEPAELALFTSAGTLALHRMADGGEAAPHDAVETRANRCRDRVEPRPGWALGWPSREIPAGLKLVPELISPDPTLSQLRGLAMTMTSLLPGQKLDAGRAAQLPRIYWFESGGERVFADPFVDDRSFGGWWSPGRLRLPDQELTGVSRFRHWQSLIVLLDEPIEQGRIWLVLEDGTAPDDVKVADENGIWTFARQAPCGPGLTAAMFALDHAGPGARIEVRWPSGGGVGFIGVGGLTAGAIAAAKAANDAAQAEADALADEAADEPDDDTEPKEVGRCVLEPGKTYRIDLEFAWDGTLVERDDQGKEKKTTKSGTDYQPPGASVLASRRSYWFRTTPRRLSPAEHATTIAPLKQYGAPGHLAFKMRRRDVFDPVMLERHFGGYDPAQSVLDRFRDDEVAAHFTVSHVAKLAAAFGYKLELELRRTDVPGKRGLPRKLPHALSFIKDAGPLGPAGRRLHAAAANGPCPQPGEGATMAADVELAARAWYELAVIADPIDPASTERGQLPPVSFRTSRWRTPRQMFTDLGFWKGGLGASNGDLAVDAAAAVAPGAIHDDDAAFDAALDALGLDGLAAPEAPRVSLLWSPGAAGAWLLSGVLVESPEPVHRPGRLAVTGLKPNGAAGFEIERRDRSGSRLLYMTATPFVPKTVRVGPFRRQPSIALSASDLLDKSVLTGHMRLRTAPDFAGEPA